MARTDAGQSPQDFAKFFFSGYHVTLCDARDADKVKR